MRRALGLKGPSTLGRYLYNEQIPVPKVMERIAHITQGQVTIEDFRDSRPPKCLVVLTLPDGKTVRLLPWSRNEQYWRMVAERVKCDTPLFPEKPAQVVLAEAMLKGRLADRGHGLYLLDGRQIDGRRLIAEANRLRLVWGQEPIAYPGVDGAELIDER